MLKKFISFTLAEVLMVAGIAAVIGSMTIPNMMKSYQKKANITKSRAVLAKLDGAMQNVDINATLRGKTTDNASAALMQALDEYLEFRSMLVNSSDTTEMSKYFNKYQLSSNPNVNQLTVRVLSTSAARAIMNDGSHILLKVAYLTPQVVDNHQNYYGYIWVDVDGPSKGPQVLGQDVFEFFIDGTGVTD